VVLFVVIILALSAAWPFNARPRHLASERDPSLWQFILSDRVTIGMIRLALVMLGLFVVISVPALVMAGRWIKGVGSGGLAADDAENASQTIEGLKTQVETLTRERDEAREALRAAEKLAAELLESAQGGPSRGQSRG
jgi:outer membrane murein-binding lipoprotein Lpp